jgi:DNA-binding beta-propeller fold protein YncE
MLIVSTSGQVTGVANAGSELYVSVSSTNRIRVYDSETLAELRSWSSDRPKQIAVDTQSNLWILQATDASNPPKILHYSKTGTLLSKQITDLVHPTALPIENKDRLLVADNCPRQQVLIYDISGTPKLIGTFGDEGGIYSGTLGEVGELKLNGLTGVGTDAAGNIYVSNNGFGCSGTDLRKFSRFRKLQWQLSLFCHFGERIRLCGKEICH